MILTVCLELEVGNKAKAGATTPQSGPEVVVDSLACGDDRCIWQDYFKFKNIVRCPAVLGTQKAQATCSLSVRTQ